MELVLKFQTDGEQETGALGEKIGGLLKPGDIVTLNGDLAPEKRGLPAAPRKRSASANILRVRRLLS